MDGSDDYLKWLRDTTR
ncbi:MAG: hypothetical protein ACE5F7_11615 [Nitrospiria bacterium]